MGRRSELLIDDKQLLVLQTKLAILVGDRQAIALQQIHYWIEINEVANKQEHYFDGCWWVYNTWAEWRKNNFPFWSLSMMRRVIADLEAAGLVTTRPHENRQKGSWVTLNYGELENQLRRFEERPTVRRPKRKELRGGSAQNEQTGLPKTTDGSAQNEQTTSDTEITTETIRKDTSDDVPSAKYSKQELDAAYEAVKAAWGISNNGLIVNYRGMLFGMNNVKGAWKEMCPEPPLTVEEFGQFVPFAKKRMRELNQGYVMPSTAEALAKRVEEFRAKPDPRSSGPLAGMNVIG